MWGAPTPHPECRWASLRCASHHVGLFHAQPGLLCAPSRPAVLRFARRNSVVLILACLLASTVAERAIARAWCAPSSTACHSAFAVAPATMPFVHPSNSSTASCHLVGVGHSSYVCSYTDLSTLASREMLSLGGSGSFHLLSAPAMPRLTKCCHLAVEVHTTYCPPLPCHGSRIRVQPCICAARPVSTGVQGKAGPCPCRACNGHRAEPACQPTCTALCAVLLCVQCPCLSSCHASWPGLLRVFDYYITGIFVFVSPLFPLIRASVFSRTSPQGYSILARAQGWRSWAVSHLGPSTWMCMSLTRELHSTQRCVSVSQGRRLSDRIVAPDIEGCLFVYARIAVSSYDRVMCRHKGDRVCICVKIWNGSERTSASQRPEHCCSALIQ